MNISVRLDAVGVRKFLVLALMSMLALVRSAAPDERDPYWSARAGLDTLAGKPLARPDEWSWWADGTWYQNSPGWNVVLGGAYGTAGWWGLFVLTLASICVYLALMWMCARRLGARLLSGLAGLSLPLLSAFPMLNARATLLVQSLLLGGVLFAVWWSRHLGRFSLVVGAGGASVVGFALSFVGNWAHLSFVVLWLAVAATWAVVWGLDGRHSPGIRAITVVAGSSGLLAGTALSPYGPAVTLERLLIVQRECAGVITEWASVPSVGRVQVYLLGLVTLGVAGAGALALIRLIRRDGLSAPKTRLAAGLLVIGFPTAVLGWSTIRLLGISLLALAPVAALVGTWGVDALRRRVRAVRDVRLRGALLERTSPGFWTVVLAGVVLVFFPITTVMAVRGARPAEMTVIDALPQHCLLVSEPGVAGPVILARPDVQVWLDGRADFFGRDRLIHAARVLAAVEPIPDQATCVILSTKAIGLGIVPDRLIKALDSDVRFTRTAEADGYALWIRK